MAQPSDTYKRTKAFFHSLSKVNTEISQYVYESLYKSAHTVRSDDIWSDTVPYAVDFATADAWVTANPTIGHKYTLQSLTEIPGSNGQGWYVDDGGAFITSWIAPTDIPHATTKDPSYGYQAQLYDSTDALIAPAVGVWNIDYYAGIVMFEQGSTPADMGWGNPKITCYNYIGARGGGSTVNAGTPVRLNSLNIDGTTNTIDTNTTLESVVGFYKDCVLTICNQNNASINVRIAHIDGVIGALANEDYLLYETEILENETKAINIPYMNTGDTIMVRSNTVNVNFILTGLQTLSQEGARIGAVDIDGTTNPIDTDIEVYNFVTTSYFVSYMICNRTALIPDVRVAHIDGVLGDLTVDDYMYSEVEDTSTKAYVLGQYYEAGDTLSFRSNNVDINIVAYGCTAPSLSGSVVGITSTKLDSGSGSSIGTVNQRTFVVTSEFPAYEIVNITTGDGLTGTSTPSGDTVILDATEASFDANGKIQVYLNGVKQSKGNKLIWDSTNTFYFSEKLDLNDEFSILQML